MKLSLFCLCLFAATLVRAEVKPAALFADHAVLQRETPVPVWGTADAGEKVSVIFAGHTVETTADATGHWRVELPAMPASLESRPLVIRGKNTVTLSDILVGEVWLASGQSNMERIMSLTFDTALEYPAAVDFPMIRQFKIAHQVAEAAAADVAGSWEPAGPKTLPQFSAVAWYFARDLHAVLRVPVGIINSTWGGTGVESWIDPATLQGNPAFVVVSQRWQQVLANYPGAKAKYDAARAKWEKQKAAATAAGQKFAQTAPTAPQGPGHQYTPSGLYNGMIAPLAPAAIRGVIWYQGEHNASHAAEYRGLFSSLITGWRRAFGQGDFPFYWVQLANYGAGAVDRTEWAFLREAQTQTLALPHTGQALAIDVGNVTNIHPKDKHDVGRRLARLALHRTYGLDVVDTGPVFASATREGAGYRVNFTHTDGGLVAPLYALSGFELAGEDRVFHPAIAKIEGDTVIATSPEVAAPAAVRYAWHNAVTAGLFNDEGLPAVPFRTDSW